MMQLSIRRAASRRSGWLRSRWIGVAIGLVLGHPALARIAAQDNGIRIRDLTIDDKAIPMRLLGYGLVVGLDGTGDRTNSSKEGGMTINSVVNLLRKFNIEVPPADLRTRNVAAVLVTAETSPYLRPGGRFEVHVSSVGDAQSLNGGVLWQTPLQYDVSDAPVGTAQGAVLTTDAVDRRLAARHENSARIPQGGLLEAPLPHTDFAQSTHLLLLEPDVTMASRIATAINKEIGAGSAKVEDPGSITLSLKTDTSSDRAALMARIADLRVQPAHGARLIIDGRDGTIVGGGDIAVGEATVSHGPITLSIGAVDTAAAPPGQVHVAAGTAVTLIAAALQRIQATPAQIAAIFEALRSVGAISAEVVIR